MFYFTGAFDGSRFSSEKQRQWLDHGHDFYAGITFEGTEERIMLAWCGNWAYARKLSLRAGRLCQTPYLLTQVLSQSMVFEGEITLEQSWQLNKADGSILKLMISPDKITLDRTGSKLLSSTTELLHLDYDLEIQTAALYHHDGLVEVFLNEGAFVISESF